MKQQKLSLPIHRHFSTWFHSLGPSRDWVLAYLGLASANIFLFTAIFVFLPEYQGLITTEDNLVETCSASLYFSAFIISLFKVCRRSNVSWKIPVLAGVSLLGFLDELSFGERLFSLSMPTLLGMKIDSAHDLIYVARNYVLGYVTANPGIGAFFIGGFLGILLLAVWKWRSQIQEFFVTRFDKSVIFLGFIFTIFGMTAIFIDLEIIENEYLFALEEILEMNSAMCLFFLSLILKK